MDKASSSSKTNRNFLSHPSEKHSGGQITKERLRDSVLVYYLGINGLLLKTGSFL